MGSQDRWIGLHFYIPTVTGDEGGCMGSTGDGEPQMERIEGVRVPCWDAKRRLLLIQARPTTISRRP